MRFPINSKNAYKYLTPAVFLGVCSYQTYKDYYSAPKDQQKKVLVRNISVLSGAMVGIMGTKKMVAYLSAANSVKSKLAAAKSAVKETVEEFIIAVGGITTALASDYLLGKTKYMPDLPDNSVPVLAPAPVNKLESNSDAINRYYQILAEKQFMKQPDTSVGAASKVFEVMGVDTAGSLDSPLQALSGLAITRQKDAKSRFKMASYDLIACTIIPTFILSNTARFTKKLPGYAKFLMYPVVSLVGLFSGDYAAKWFDKNVSQKIANQYNVYKSKQPIQQTSQYSK